MCRVHSHSDPTQGTILRQSLPFVQSPPSKPSDTRMASRQRGRKVFNHCALLHCILSDLAQTTPRQPFRDITNALPAELQTQIKTYRQQLRNSSSIYHELLTRKSLTTRDEHSIRFLDIVFNNILNDLKRTNEDMKSSGLQTLYDEFSVAAEQLGKLWALSRWNLLPPEIISHILSFLTPEPYDVLAPSPIAVALVKKSWRNAALHSPNLWTRLIITNEPTNPRTLNYKCALRVTKALKLSGSEPLVIRLEFPFFNDPDMESVWATQIVIAVVGEHKRWAKAAISLTPDHMALLNKLKGDHLGIVQKLSLMVNIAPGDAERELDGVRALRASLLPRLGNIPFKGLEPLASFSTGEIVDDSVGEMTVEEGADLHCFTLPKLQHVHIVRKGNPAGYKTVGDRTPSTFQLSSVHSLVKRSSSCTVRSLSLTNPVLSIEFLMGIDEAFPGLRTLRIKMKGAYDPRILNVLPVLANTDWLSSLTTLALWIQSTNKNDYRDTRDKCLTEAFLQVLRSRAGKGGKLRELALFPDASMLMNKDVLKKLKALKSVKVTQLEEFS